MPATLRVALGLLWAQFLALTAVLIFFASLTVRKPTPLAFYVIAFGIAIVVALFVTIRLLHRRRLSGRGGAFALQLLFLAPAYYMITGGLWVGWVVIVWIVAVTAALFVPSTAQALS